MNVFSTDWINSQCTRTFTKMCYYMMYYYSYVVTFYSDLFNRLTMKFPPLMVYKVMQVTDDGYEECTDLYFKGLPLKSHSDQRIEYRVTWNRAKYRVVNESPRYDMFLRRDAKKIIMAVLHNPVENVEENVIQRVVKFAGPNHDFFETDVRMRWLFESDDVLDETVLVLLMSNGAILKFEPDDVISLKA